MENASKALLIAGSVLIAILLIAMGVRVFNSTTGMSDATESSMQTAEAMMFNNKFSGYMNKTLTQAEARSLLQLIQANNATSPHKVSINLTEDIIQKHKGFSLTKMKNNPKYDSNGFITSLTYDQYAS